MGLTYRLHTHGFNPPIVGLTIGPIRVIGDQDLRNTICSTHPPDIRYGVWCNGDLRGITFAGGAIHLAEMGGLDLSRSTFSGAVFFSCDFRGTNFSYANLEGARFFHCKFGNTRFQHTNLRNTVFVNLIDSGRDFGDCMDLHEDNDFTGADLRNSNILPR